MPATSACPDLESLDRIVHGAGLPDEIAALASHVRECPACQKGLEGRAVCAEFESALRRQAGDSSTGTLTFEYLSRPDVSTLLGQRGERPKLSDLHVPGYEILDELGRGGMGVVYKARQLSLKRIVALKMILAGSHASEEELGRFCREAEAVARLQHPNIVQVYEIGNQGGIWYFSLELVDGGSLSQRLKGPALPAQEAAALVSTLGRAIDHAHQRGIVHRDLKPGNVLLMSDGTPKITDFGLAKQLETDSQQTRTGAVMGTPSYMAPEQALGQTHDIGPLTDVYALGAILYELLAGRPPFKGESVFETMEQVRNREAAPPSHLRPDVPRDLETICLKALAKDPRQRYASALALANDLDRFRAGEPILARRQGVFAKVWRGLRRHSGKVAALAGMLAVVTISLALVLSARTSSRAADLEREIVAALDESKLQVNEEYVAGVEGKIAELEQLSPAQAATLRHQLGDRLRQWAGRAITQAPDYETARARIDPLLPLISSRYRVHAETLVKQLEDRKDIWDAVVQLTAPFADAEKTFDPGIVRIENKSLVVTAPKSKSPREQPLLPGLVLMKHASPQNAEARVRFQPSWEKARMLGLVLNGSMQRGYAFVVEREDRRSEKGKKKGDAEAVAPPSTTARLQIRRNGVILVQQVLDTSLLISAPLELWARREGDRLQCQINRLKVLEYHDPFPLTASEPGVVGLVCSAPVQVESLSVFRKHLSARPSVLDRGDALFEEERFDEARALYRHEADLLRSGELWQQARYKEALCCLATRREQEAASLFKDVAASEGLRWPVMADCQLWLLLLQRSDTQSQLESAAIIQRLLVRKLSEEHLAGLLPEKIRERLLAGVTISRLDLFFSADKNALVRDLEQLVALERVLESDFFKRKGTENTLLRAYRLAEREEEAIDIGRRILEPFKEIKADNDTVRRTVEYVAWAMRRQKRPGDALREVDYWIGRGQALGQPFRAWQLLNERARAHVAAGAWAKAENDVDGAILERPAKRNTAELDTLCMKGFLRLRDGDEAGARAAWQEGVSAYRELQDVSMTPFLLYTIMFSLGGEPSDEECKNIQRVFLARMADEAQAKAFLDVLANLQPARVFRDMWRTPRGRELARRLAFRDCTYGELGTLPLTLIAAETAHQIALPGPITSDQEELLWDLSHNVLQAYAAHKFKPGDIIALGSTFKGIPWFWDGVKKTLDPSLGGPIAYLFGHRYVHLNRPRDAESFFRTAFEAAPAGSSLQRLARIELDKLKKK